MSTTQELLAAKAVEAELRAELALVSEQHAAACAKYDGLKTRTEALVDEFESNIDWSSGRLDYGDNGAWEQAARSLRSLVDNA